LNTNETLSKGTPHVVRFSIFTFKN
jgi:hypothetical protein